MANIWDTSTGGWAGGVADQDYDWSFGGPLTKETGTTYGGSKPGKSQQQKQPDAPDAFELIRAQGLENRVNQIGPSGSTMFNRDPETGVWTANRSFSPELQGLYNQQLGMLSDPDAYDANVAGATFERQRGMLDPIFSQQNEYLTSKLANQGIPMGAEAYDTDWTRQQEAQNEAYSRAALDSIVTGKNIGMAERGSTFNQLAALLGGQQVGPISPIDVMGPNQLQYQGQVGAVNAANQYGQQQDASRMQGVASLASILMMMCWVAEELFGKTDDRTHAIRAYLVPKIWDGTFVGEFARFYSKHGISWADKISKKTLGGKALRLATKLLFKGLLELALREQKGAVYA